MWILAVVAVLALVGAACGSDDDGGDEGSDETSDGGGETAAGMPTCLDNAAMYALVGPESQGIGNWADASELATTVESDYAEDLPDQELVITAPGEESGTYDSFVELVIEDIAEAQGLPEEEWVTRPDYTASADDNAIIEGISGTDGSFGWVGYAFYDENKDKVTAFEIAGEDGTCVAPTAETIADGSYPLSRPLFIYVNAENAAENPALACFVDFYLSDEGYADVAEADYVQLTEEAWDETISTWESEGTAGGDCSDLSGDVVVSGSSTVEPISSLVGEQFSGDTGVGVQVDGPGTGDGFELFCNGETDVSDASRAIDDEEIAACEGNGVEYIELQIGIDGLSVLTAAGE